MSTRTIIEINHDYLTMLDDKRWCDTLLFRLRFGVWDDKSLQIAPLEPAIRILGQRHHSEPEWKQEPGNG